MIKEFNLLREKWVLVLDSKGNSREVSLIEAFQAAYIIKCLAGELQAQDIAVLRLMLAVLYSVFTRVSIDGDYKELTNERQAVNRWVDLWKSRRFPIEPIEDYLNRYSERFYLFHEHTPFYQVPITVNIGTEFAAAKLIGDLAESANKPNVFAERARSLKNGVTYSEAVRWLLYLNAYDDISVSPKLRKGLGIGRLGKLGLVYAAGDNLFETLMLNFSLLSDQNERFRPGKAVWEKELYITDRALVKTPASPAELLTLQSRRISLLRDNGTVTGYKLYGGDIMNEENAFIEHMTRWGKDDDEKRDVYKPKRLNPYKPLWRKFPALIMNTEKTKRPGVIEWLAVLTKKGLISGNIG